jgi:hypothetical protein
MAEVAPWEKDVARRMASPIYVEKLAFKRGEVINDRGVDANVD